MVRPLRTEYAGALYHLTSRGNVRKSRDCAMAAAYMSWHYSMVAIGKHFGMGRSTVARTVKSRQENG